MQAELSAVTTVRPIFILGINEIGQQSGNNAMVNGRVLPWMQDTTEVGAWDLWQAEFRDVIIVDQLGQRVTAYNLTSHDLSNAEHYAELKTLLLDAANQPD